MQSRWWKNLNNCTLSVRSPTERTMLCDCSWGYALPSHMRHLAVESRGKWKRDFTGGRGGIAQGGKRSKAHAWIKEFRFDLRFASRGLKTPQKTHPRPA